MASEHQTPPTEETLAPVGEQGAITDATPNVTADAAPDVTPNATAAETPVETSVEASVEASVETSVETSATTASTENAPENAPSPEEKPRIHPRDLLTDLRTRFEIFRTFQPLIIGIDKDVRAHYPEVDRKTLRAALSMHTRSNRYLRQLAKAKQRFNLKGEVVAELSEEHRQFAATQLQERMERQQARQTEMDAQTPASQSENAASHPVQRPQGVPGKPRFARDSAKKPRTDKTTHRTTNSAKPVNAEGSLPETSVRTAPDRKPHKNAHSGKSEKSRNGKRSATNDKAAESKETKAFPANTTLAEKLALLAEKFGRK